MSWIVLLEAGCSSVRGRSGSVDKAAARDDQSIAAAPFQSKLDHLIEDSWRGAKVAPAAPADDGAFLRRASLDLIGRIPTLDEAKAFLGDSHPDKRSRSIDRLLATRDFGEHWADVYSDLIFGQEARAQKLQNQYDPRAWLVRAFNENWAYDRLTHEVLTASGELRDNGALAFVVARARGGGVVEAVTGAAARIFLGLQIQCAQCHDHPYDPRWRQEDFYGLVAYFSRTRSKNQKMESMDAMEGEGKTFVVVDVKRGQAKMRRPGSETDVSIAPRFLGTDVSPRSGETLRQTFARAVVSSDLFPKAMVARTWAQLFGRGIVDPWDDLGAENDPKHPAVLKALASDFAGNGYNIKRLIRMLVLSNAYQRGLLASNTEKANGDGTAVHVFAQAAVRPLLPEQLFKSLLAATGVESMGRGREADPDRRKKRLVQAFREFTFVFADDEMAEANSFNGSVPQALLLFNGELVNEGSRAAPQGVLGAILERNRDAESRLDEMFLAAYTRRPTPEERQQLGAYLKRQQGARAAYEDLYFALLTSTEATTNH